MKNFILFLMIFLVTTCKKEVGPTPTPDARDKYVGFYEGIYSSYAGCDSANGYLPFLISQSSEIMVVSKYEGNGFSIKSTFINYNFDSFKIFKGEILYMDYIEAWRDPIIWDVTIVNDSLFYYYANNRFRPIDSRCHMPYKYFTAKKI